MDVVPQAEKKLPKKNDKSRVTTMNRRGIIIYEVILSFIVKERTISSFRMRLRWTQNLSGYIWWKKISKNPTGNLTLSVKLIACHFDWTVTAQICVLENAYM
jgi:hypothetical protein